MSEKIKTWAVRREIALDLGIVLYRNPDHIAYVDQNPTYEDSMKMKLGHGVR